MHRFLVIQERRSGSQVSSFVAKFEVQNVKLGETRVYFPTCNFPFYPVHCAGVEGDSATQSSDGTDQENYQHEEQAGWGEEEQNSSGSSEAGEGEFGNKEEGEEYGETSGADTTGDGSVCGEDSRDFTTDEGQEGDSSKDGQDMEEGRVVSYLGDSFGSSGMGDLSGGVLEEGELARGMEKKGIYYLPTSHS